MFCYQCEQTKRSVNNNNETMLGCAAEKGSCGKDSTTSDLQDLFIYLLQAIAHYQVRLAAIKGVDKPAAEFILYGLFTTLTNVNFNPTRFGTLIQEAAQLRDRLKAELLAHNGHTDSAFAGLNLIPAVSVEGMLEQAKAATILAQQTEVGNDVVGLRALILYGLKGVAAYAHHALVLQHQSDVVHLEMARLLDYLTTQPVELEDLLQQALAVGTLNLKVLELLDRANTESFGEQQVTAVRITPVAGRAILVSGHDLQDLKQLLEQTKDQGVNVYTHGEMLPAHAYPGLKAYTHLVGNYGGAWQHQQQEFADFPGPILLTSNCLIEPQPIYRQRLFTTGPVGWPGIRHLQHDNFAPLLQIAKAMPGFKETEMEQTITVGFGRHTLFQAAETVINAVKSGAIKHFFLIGGCDGAVPGRNYYTELAEAVPQDCVILTLGCGKYRFNKQSFGTIGGLPRLLDLGQCNDSYTAIEIAKALAGAFNCGVNELPLSLMVSWFEQKATAVFLALLALNVRNIHLGPTLPAYLTPNLLQILQTRFAVRANTTAAADLAEALAA